MGIPPHVHILRIGSFASLAFGIVLHLCLLVLTELGAGILASMGGPGNSGWFYMVIIQSACYVFPFVLICRFLIKNRRHSKSTNLVRLHLAVIVSTIVGLGGLIVALFTKSPPALLFIEPGYFTILIPSAQMWVFATASDYRISQIL